MGKNDNLMWDIFDLFKPLAVIAYTDTIHDKYCFLYESILLSIIEFRYQKSSKSDIEKIFEDFQDETMFMKNMNKKYSKSHPMQIYI